jgi:hypothetical protein
MMENKTFKFQKIISVIFLLILSSIAIPFYKANPEKNRNISFSNSTLIFQGKDSKDIYISFPMNSTIVNATLDITGEPYTSGGQDYPSDVTLDVGSDSIVEWQYANESYGTMGHQYFFNTSSLKKNINLTKPGSVNNTSIFLPMNARILSASMNVQGLISNPNLTFMQNLTGNGKYQDFFGKGTGGDWNGDDYSDLAIGESCYDNGSILDTGRISIYYSNNGKFSTTPNKTYIGRYQNQFLSRTYWGKKLNNDKYSDLIIPQENISVFVYYGSNLGLKAQPDKVLEVNQGSGRFTTVEATCDFNNDGYSDLVIGDPKYNVLNYGRIFIFNGSSNGINSIPDFNITGNQNGWNLGTQLACAGDVNKDGYDDLLVGNSVARLYLYLGSSKGLKTISTTTINAGYFIGVQYSLSGGDINGDGYSDAIMGIFNKDIDGKTSAGTVQIYYGSASGLSTLPNITINGSAANGEFGYESLVIQDMNKREFGSLNTIC